MLNRNRSDLDRARRYYDPDDYEETAQPRDRVPWFGLYLKVSTVTRVGFGITGLMVLLIFAYWQFADGIAWIPNKTLWFNAVFLVVVMLMSFTSLSMFRAATNMFKQEIREIDARTARRDNATEEEVEEYVRRSEKRMNRTMTKRWIFMLVILGPLYPVIGTNLIFPWGNILFFVAASVVVFGGVIIWCYHRQDVANRILRLFRGAPR